MAATFVKGTARIKEVQIQHFLGQWLVNRMDSTTQCTITTLITISRMRTTINKIKLVLKVVVLLAITILSRHRSDHIRIIATKI